jgi:hypothetical protein
VLNPDAFQAPGQLHSTCTQPHHAEIHRRRLRGLAAQAGRQARRRRADRPRVGEVRGELGAHGGRRLGARGDQRAERPQKRRSQRLAPGGASGGASAAVRLQP